LYSRHVAIIRLLALTGARKSEIACLRWSELYLDRSLLRLRDSKTGLKVIPLGEPPLELLAALKLDYSQFYFPDRRWPSQPIASLDWAWVGIRRKAGLGGVQIHDLRHTFASAGLANGEGLPLIGKTLGHATDRISRNVADAMHPQASHMETDHV
jgi:integrase